MVDPVRNKQHGNGDRNDNDVAKADEHRHEQHDRRLAEDIEQKQKQRKRAGDDDAP